MVRAANQSLRIERDILLRHPGKKNLFYILFERIINDNLNNSVDWLCCNSLPDSTVCDQTRETMELRTSYLLQAIHPHAPEGTNYYSINKMLM